MAYQFVQVIEGARTNLRPCLQGKPKFKSFAGPCNGGNVNGVDVIRYEKMPPRADDASSLLILIDPPQPFGAVAPLASQRDQPNVCKKTCRVYR